MSGLPDASVEPLTPPPSPRPPVSPVAPAPSQGVAIAALLINALIWPGLGSLIAGEQVGWAQGFLFLGGVVLALILIGIPILIGAWIWGIVTGVQLVDRASQQRAMV